MKKNKKRRFLILLAIFLIIPFFIGILENMKRLPAGISMDGALHEDGSIKLITDLTYEQENRVMEQTLYAESLRLIREAEDSIIVDMFLFNDDYDRAKGSYPARAEEMANTIIDTMKEKPNLNVTVITDGINSVYGSTKPYYFQLMKDAGVHVIETNMKPLKDSNPIFSSIWRTYLQWLPLPDKGIFPNAFNPDGDKISIHSYLQLLNFKANHRKVVLNEKEALLTSANVTHDGSSYHSNIGFIVTGNILKDIYESELAVAKLSNNNIPTINWKKATESTNARVKLITEGKIKETMLSMINETNIQNGSSIQVGVFYLSDRQIIKALKKAAKRDVPIQIILDPNKDAFGIEKNGIPNRQVAAELIKNGAEIRWYDTNGEQFHSKFLFINSNETAQLLGGSANFTRRNLADYNLESNLYVEMNSDHPIATELSSYFERMWTNEDGQFTVDYEVYEDKSIWKKFFYRFQEFTGLSTF